MTNNSFVVQVTFKVFKSCGVETWDQQTVNKTFFYFDVTVRPGICCMFLHANSRSVKCRKMSKYFRLRSYKSVSYFVKDFKIESDCTTRLEYSADFFV